MQLIWLKKIFEQLLWQKKNNKMQNAILLVGPEGNGKTELFEYFAKELFCSNDGCKNCRNCSLLDAKSHPDYMIIKEPLKIDMTTSVNYFVNKKAQINDKKVIVITNLHKATTQAKNALLKTVEEPNNTIFLFTATDEKLILPTILSRCQLIKSYLPSFEEVKGYFSEDEDFVKLCLLSGIGPVKIKNEFSLINDNYNKILLAISLTLKEKNLSKALQQIKDLELEVVIHWVMFFLTNIFSLKDFSSFKMFFNIKSILELYSYVVSYKEKISNNVGLSKQLIMDDIFILIFRLSKSG